jgi:hypothetical protein
MERAPSNLVGQTSVCGGLQPNAAYFSHKRDSEINWWGGPPGPRGTPSSRWCVKNQSAATTEKPTRGSAADEGVRPTRCAIARKRGKHVALGFSPPSRERCQTPSRRPEVRGPLWGGLKPAPQLTSQSDFAASRHSEQRRTGAVGEPYVNHLLANSFGTRSHGAGPRIKSDHPHAIAAQPVKTS